VWGLVHYTKVKVTLVLKVILKVTFFVQLDFYAPRSNDLGHIILPLSVHLSVCCHTLTFVNLCKYLPQISTYKAHILYEGCLQ